MKNFLRKLWDDPIRMFLYLAYFNAGVFFLIGFILIFGPPYDASPAQMVERVELGFAAIFLGSIQALFFWFTIEKFRPWLRRILFEKFGPWLGRVLHLI